jgi:double-strand break repair protein AddB
LINLGQLIRKLLITEPDLAPISATYELAESLAALMDEAQGEGIQMTDVLNLDVGEHSAHWNRSKKFLSILATHWEQNALTDPQDRMRHVVETYATHWDKNPTNQTILIAGSTGSRGATALFMKAVSKLPNGAVILPGVDDELPREVWSALKTKKFTLDHPQAGFAKLFNSLNIDFDDVGPWHESDAKNIDRNKLISLALRPAPITNQWLEYGPRLKPYLSKATQNLELIEADTIKEEALTIATRLRYAAEVGQEAVLISPSRNLTRRVNANLERWGIEADDSAGIPLQLSTTGIFLRSLAKCFGNPTSSHDFLALLKHPLTHSGKNRNIHNLMVMEIEVGQFNGTKILRGGPPFIDFDLLSGWASKDPSKEIWSQWLSNIFQPLQTAREMELYEWLHLLKKTAENLSDSPEITHESKVWEKDSGVAALKTLDQIMTQSVSSGLMSSIEFNAFLRSALNQELRPEAQSSNPLISIWGTLEARVQSKDLVILGGLNEDTWPTKSSHDMWLNRDMRKQLSLLLPERRIGLSAHDFQQAISSANVVLSRSLRDGDTPSTPSRWLIRITNLMNGLKDEGPQTLEEMRNSGNYWLACARSLDKVAENKKIPFEMRPSPIPPKHARLKKLSVTQIKDLVRDPYKIYASVILNLKKLEPLGKQADAIERGNTIHTILEEFIKQTKNEFPEDASDLFMKITNNVLKKDVPWPAARRLWLARMHAVSSSFINEEIKRRTQGVNIALERRGEMDFHDLKFKLTAKADRIDQGKGGLRLYDYKASKPPSLGDIQYFDKQLQLEAMIAFHSGFNKIQKQSIEHLEYISLGPDLNKQAIDIDDQEVSKILNEFRSLILIYNDTNKGFTARDKIQFLKHMSDYDQLSRKGEWQDSDIPNPRVVG